MDQEQVAEAPARAEEAGVPVLPGRFREARVQEVPAPAPPEVAPPAPAPVPKPTDTRLLLTVPRLGLTDITVGDSPKQSYLDREGIMHLSGTGFPFKRNSNTYIAGHAGDFGRSRIPNVFRNLNSLRQGDLIALRDANGKTYNYRVYNRLVVNPRDVWVTDPIPGKKIVSLQTCFPAPTYEKRLIVRGELVK
ncbi:MAG: class E sortase [Rubrobacteraceae bacterium]